MTVGTGERVSTARIRLSPSREARSRHAVTPRQGFEPVGFDFVETKRARAGRRRSCRTRVACVRVVRRTSPNTVRGRGRPVRRVPAAPHAASALWEERIGETTASPSR